MKQYTVREYARLTTDAVSLPSLDRVQIPASAFDWLAELCGKDAMLGELRSRTELQLKSLVGVLTTPCGVQLEMLPKTQHDADRASEGRRQLIRMLTKLIDADCRSFSTADISLFERPLTEWVARQFLLRLHELMKHGLRCDYKRVEEESSFLRGQLDVHRQMQQPPHRRHVFHVRHDVFLEDRPENRLLRSALERVRTCVRLAENWRLAASLCKLMQPVPFSRDVQGDFSQWRRDRLMASYAAIRPWCELVLGKDMPYAVSHSHTGMSMLFSMDVLFERYVAQTLRGKLVPGSVLEAQSEGWLCSRSGHACFKLRPDIVVCCGGRTWVLDTKWKRIEKSSDVDNHDVYQLYVYGRQWTHGTGDVALVYPEHEKFPHPQRPFQFMGEEMRLLVTTFDLNDDRLRCGLDEEEKFPWLAQ